MKRLRLICRLMGCRVIDDVYCPQFCDRCGAESDPYDGNVSDMCRGLIWLAWHPVHRLYGMVHIRRCAECRKRLSWFPVQFKYTIEFCSEECQKQWIPF